VTRLGESRLTKRLNARQRLRATLGRVMGQPEQHSPWSTTYQRRGHFMGARDRSTSLRRSHPADLENYAFNGWVILDARRMRNALARFTASRP
jgi:hypothetical protein